jgi:hypothetical protein
MAGRSTTSRRLFERDYPHCVLVPVPDGSLGRKLDDMIAWCRERGGDWQVYGSRFYFKAEADAEAFRQRWLL